MGERQAASFVVDESTGRSMSLPFSNTAPARTRCGAFTARQRASAASISLNAIAPRTNDVRVRERLVAVAIGDEAVIQIIERANELSQREPTEYFEACLNTILDDSGPAAKARRRQRSRTFRYGADERSDPAATPANDG